MKNLSEIKRGSLDLKAITGEIKSVDRNSSRLAAMKLAHDAADYGLPIREFLQLAVTPSDGLDGYELMLAELNLPVRQDLSKGITLQAAADTFQTFAGARALFPAFMDDVVRFASRQDSFEQVSQILAGSHTVAGTNEVIMTVIDDDSAQRGSFLVPEGGKIPVRSIRASERTVKFWKHGSGLRFTYEFARRSAIEMMIPFAARVQRELELSKMLVATALIQNGDGVAPAATSVNQSSYDATTGVTSVNGTITWENLLYWLVQRAKAGTPVDTVMMNWDGWFKWNMLFAAPTVSASNKNFGPRAAENLSAAGANLIQQAVALNLNVTPVLSSGVSANTLIGITKGETLEELVEANANIQETEQMVSNQTVTMYKTENTGYRLPFTDTRSIYNFGA